MSEGPSANDVSAPPDELRAKRRRALKWVAVKVAVALLVAWALAWHIRGLGREWAEQEEFLDGLSVGWSWVGLALLAYGAGQLCFACFWGRLLRRMGVSASWPDVLRSYAIGTLGKYVPGKALVVITRTALLGRQAAGHWHVGMTVVYETLAVMAVGAWVATACLVLATPGDWYFWSCAGAVAVAFSGAVHPAVFGRIAGLAALPFGGVRKEFAAVECWAALVRWSPLLIAGWFLAGLSFWAAASAIGVDCASVDGFLLIAAAAGLATTVGFLVVFLPAGIGVRELVIIQLLAPWFGRSMVVISALLLRTVWTMAELGMAGGLHFTWRFATRADAGGDSRESAGPPVDLPRENRQAGGRFRDPAADSPAAKVVRDSENSTA